VAPTSAHVAAKEMARILRWTSGAVLQEVTLHRGAVPPVTGQPVLNVRRYDGALGVALPDEPKLMFGVLDAPAGPTGFVVDMTIGESLRGTGSALWVQVRSAARAAGLVGIDLEAEGIGGYFWAKHGFELSRPRRDAAPMLAHMAKRAGLLAQLNHPVSAQLAAWFTQPGARLSEVS